jgi:hypothetical protein
LDEQLLGKEYIFVQDRDSAYLSKITSSFMERKGIDYLELPSNPPNLSVMETYVSIFVRDWAS